MFGLAQFPLYMHGDAAVSLYGGAALARELDRIHSVVFTRILLGLGLVRGGA